VNCKITFQKKRKYLCEGGGGGEGAVCFYQNMGKKGGFLEKEGGEKNKVYNRGTVREGGGGGGY